MLLLAGLALLPVGAAQAAEVDIRQAMLELADDGSLMLNASVRFELPRAADEALHKGTPLYFVAEAQVQRARWYWLDEDIGRGQHLVRLSFEPLLRRYKVSVGGLTRTLETQEQALGVVQSGIRIKIAERGALKPDERYRLEFSFRLDPSRLPRPFQVGALAQRDFLLQAERRSTFRLSDLERAAAERPPPPSSPAGAAASSAEAGARNAGEPARSESGR